MDERQPATSINKKGPVARGSCCTWWAWRETTSWCLTLMWSALLSILSSFTGLNFLLLWWLDLFHYTISVKASFGCVEFSRGGTGGRKVGCGSLVVTGNMGLLLEVLLLCKFGVLILEVIIDSENPLFCYIFKFYIRLCLVQCKVGIFHGKWLPNTLFYIVRCKVQLICFLPGLKYFTGAKEFLCKGITRLLDRRIGSKYWFLYNKFLKNSKL